MKGTYNLILENFSAAERIYEELLGRNVESGEYYEHLIISKQLSEECFYRIPRRSINNISMINKSDENLRYPMKEFLGKRH